jgi:hypothetical protein
MRFSNIETLCRNYWAMRSAALERHIKAHKRLNPPPFLRVNHLVHTICRLPARRPSQCPALRSPALGPDPLPGVSLTKTQIYQDCMTNWTAWRTVHQRDGRCSAACCCPCARARVQDPELAWTNCGPPRSRVTGRPDAVNRADPICGPIP